MADETDGGVTPGDRVTFVDTLGDRHRAVCTTVHGPSTIAVAHRDGDDFDAWGGGDEFVEKTSVPAAEERELEPFSYVEGWSAA